MDSWTAVIERDGIGNIRLYSYYSAAFVADWKLAIPASERSWNPVDKYWTIGDGAVAPTVKLLRDYGYSIMVDRNVSDPTYSPVVTPVEDIIRVNYLGNPRRRGDGSEWALGMDERGRWDYRFPIETLRDWFGFLSNPLAAVTLYGVLSVRESATVEEIKRAYRRLVRVWHPDVNGDPEAGDVFMGVKKAYQVLSDSKTRRKYDTGLRLMGDKSVNTSAEAEIVWTVPARWRCGYLKVEQHAGVGKIVVDKILAWDDIINDGGQRMTAWWETDHPVSDWV